MQSKVERNRVAFNLWTARIIPIVLAGVVGYATYVLVALLCVNYLLNKHHDHAAAIPILVVYFVLFLLMAACFFRLVYITIVEPPYVPLGPRALRERIQNRVGSKSSSEESGIGGAEYDPGVPRGETSGVVAGSDNDPDSPGLELFYTKDVFVCDMDGKPKWCTYCANWKPDRAHHSSDCGRCIRKMDHFCPWVGGAVGENNFKFFIQFNSYTALYCFHLLVVMAIYVAKQKNTEGETLNPQFAVILGLATFFGLFTFGMAVTSIDLAMGNFTQVEKLGARSVVHILAILKSPRIEIARRKNESASEPFYREITYPLGAGVPPNSEYYQPAGMPKIKAYSHAQQSEPIVSPANPAQNATGARSNGHSSDLNGGALTMQSIPKPREELPGMTAENNEPVQASVSPPQPVPQMEVRQDDSIRERLSKRDLNATRTFAVLPMSPGDNPWNLGSRLLNFKTVMGTHVLDWFLPIRRSPCCNHEDAESQYQVGPWVDLLKSSVGFIAPQNPNTVPRRRRTKRRDHKSRKGVDEYHDGQRHDQMALQNQFVNVANTTPSRPDPSIPLQDFNCASAGSPTVCPLVDEN